MSMFELADVWCSTTSAAAYSHFLVSLYNQITSAYDELVSQNG
jgi:hypothetical protein